MSEKLNFQFKLVKDFALSASSAKPSSYLWVITLLDWYDLPLGMELDKAVPCVWKNKQSVS